MRRTSWVRLAILGCLVALVATALSAVPASAATNPALVDCNAHGTLTGSYSISQLRQALSAMSPATKEYTSCPDAINRALATAVSVGGNTGSGTGASGSGSFLPTPVIIILVLLILAAITFGAAAVRRRRDDPGRGVG